MTAARSFVTARLTLTALTQADAPAVAALHADPRVVPLLLDGVPGTIEHAAVFIAWATGHYAHRYGTFAARRRDDGTFAGLFSLTPFEDGDTLELGGKLAPIAWGRDLAVEAGAALIDHALGALGRSLLVSAIHPGNRAAAAALARLGFAFERDALVFGRPASLFHLNEARWLAQGQRPRPRRPSVRRDNDAPSRRDQG